MTSVPINNALDYTNTGSRTAAAETTFSTFGYETVRLMEEGAGLVALAILLGSLAAGLAAAALGLGIGLL